MDFRVSTKVVDTASEQAMCRVHKRHFKLLNTKSNGNGQPMKVFIRPRHSKTTIQTSYPQQPPSPTP